MKEAVNKYFNVVSKAGIVLVLLSAFFLFSNLTTEFYDTPKFLVLLAITGILLVLIALRSAFSNKVVLIKTPLDIPLLLLLTVAIVSTVASSSPYVALLGNQLKIHGSLVAIICLVLFYFVTVNTLKSKKDVNFILFIVTIAAAILSVITLLAYSGMKLLPDPWSHGVNFTPTGSNFSTTAILALLVPVVASKILSSKNPLLLATNSLLLTLYGITVALTGTLATWVAAGLGLLLILVTNRVYDRLKSLSPLTLISLITPIALTLLVVLLSFVPPMGKAKNPLYDGAKAFAPLQELQLGLVSSWKVSVSAFRDTPFWGSGPATYQFDFTNYKPIEVNSSKVWNIRFDSAFNEYLQTLAVLGGVGLIALLSFTALFISSAYPSLAFRHSLSAISESSEEQMANSERQALAIAGLMFIVLLALHASTLVVWIFGLFLLACFYLLSVSGSLSNGWTGNGNIQHTLKRIVGNFASSNSSEETIKIEALPSILLTVVLGLVLFTFFFAGKYVLADYHHRIALNAAASNQVVPAYNELIIAEKLNPQSDLYRTDLAQINFALANAIAQAKAPTEASPGGSLNDQDKQNIQVLLQQSINEAKAGTELSPKSALNWEILGLLYRRIAGVADNALTFSLDSYGKAIFQDPLNPNLRLSVGGVYYAIANYDLAIRFFTDAINLKPDFANGYYNLSVALRDKGDLQTAQVAAEKMLTLVDNNSEDYKLGNEYLTDLKNRIASGSAKQSDIKAPASETQSSLQQQKLPKVVDVGATPEKIASPTAVKKPNSTPEPTPGN